MAERANEEINRCDKAEPQVDVFIMAAKTVIHLSVPATLPLCSKLITEPDYGTRVRAAELCRASGFVLRDIYYVMNDSRPTDTRAALRRHAPFPMMSQDCTAAPSNECR
ncbi:hypothetical protein E2C01_043368 [Portunus trituberculatus]|uniref:Uncharacterized protein n=1 Tax=Portunus trituberculatus TaxID=210409 RepID=A0A5B7FSS2_PORTR|nr:hypothetical protein [Portunus trituberculatus]